jgi:hypothetical protein
MNRSLLLPALLSLPLAAASFSVAAQDGAKKASSQKNSMSFFITSKGSGKGGDLGGLKGADAHCQELAKAAGAGNRTWHAYLSTQQSGGVKAVNARDRIGKGPWYNAKGELIAKTVEDLHIPDENKIGRATGVDEKGGHVNARGEKPNKHDILTGSDSQGRAWTVIEDMTCRNWTSSSDQNHAQLGHFDREGNQTNAPSRSWNMAHMSAGCSQPALVKTGGDGLFYCFAVR